MNLCALVTNVIISEKWSKLTDLVFEIGPTGDKQLPMLSGSSLTVSEGGGVVVQLITLSLPT